MPSSSRASKTSTSSDPPSPRHSPTEITNLLPHTPRPHSPAPPPSSSSAKPSPRISKHGRTISVSQRSVAGSVRGYGAVPRPSPAEQVPRVSKAGQRRVLTTAPLQIAFFSLVILTFLALVSSLLLFLNTALDLSVVSLPYRGSGFAEFWFSAVGSWISLGAVFFFSYPSYLFFLTTLMTAILVLPILLLTLLSPCLNRAHSPLFLVPLLLTLFILLTTLLSNYLVRRARFKESQRVSRMLTEAAAREREGEEAAARVAMGMEKGFGGRVVAFLFGVIGFIAGLAGLVLVLLLLIDLSITAFDCSVPLPSAASNIVSVRPPKSPWSTRIHFACLEPSNATVLPQKDQSSSSEKSRNRHLPTVLYQSPSGVPGSLALLNHPLPPSSLEAENPGKWIFDLQNEGSVGKVCIWDRPGYGFSEVLSGADLGIVADALYDALSSSGEVSSARDGFMLVGEGYGSLVSRIFASRHPDIIHSLLHIEAETATTYFSENPRGLSVPALTAHRIGTRLLPSLLTPLSIIRLPSLLFRRSSSLSRILASTHPAPSTAYLSESLQKARLQETFAAHSHTSSSFVALLESGESYPSRKPTIVISSQDRMDADEEWAVGQRVLSEEVIDESGLLSWEKVRGVGHRACEGEGKGVCEKSLKRLLGH